MAEVKLPQATRVKSKLPANQQITAEQIIREAKSIQEDDFSKPRQRITDPEELAEYQLGKRKEYEDLIRRMSWNQSIWVKYAQWEESQKDYPRARSVWERALEVNYRSTSLWLKYAEMEMRGKFINHARNVWDRACTLLPRVDQLWYKYVHMEEMLGNIAGARQVFERWMQWEPDDQGWRSYINMELRYQETDRARSIFEKYVLCHPTVKAWVHFAKFEVKQGLVAGARSVYERAVEALGLEGNTIELFIKFAKFEEHCKEFERARAIYKYALDNIPKTEAEEMYKEYVVFEKQFGQKDGIEEVIDSKRRFEYEEQLKENPGNYDTWFDYLRLEEGGGAPEHVRALYERAVGNVPPGQEKRYWLRYIYLWINYALYEELEMEDVERTREVYRQCLKLIPHKEFTFGKIWVLAAQFEIRQKRLKAARTILGTALGMAPKAKVFKDYISLELQLGNVDRCRKLYEKFLEWDASNCITWCKFAELETSLGEAERARAILELAVAQPVLETPELVWKAYIDFEIGEGNRGGARELYERLLEKTAHVKVWMSFATFEATPLHALAEDEGAEVDADQVEGPEGPAGAAARQARARSIYERAYKHLREEEEDAKEETVMLLEAWKAFEAGAGGSAEVLAAVEKKFPRRVKKRRAIHTADGTQAGLEEYYDYIFPDEDGAAPNLKLLEAAYRWKKQKTAETAEG